MPERDEQPPVDMNELIRRHAVSPHQRRFMERLGWTKPERDERDARREEGGKCRMTRRPGDPSPASDTRFPSRRFFWKFLPRSGRTGEHVSTIICTVGARPEGDGMLAGSRLLPD